MGKIEFVHDPVTTYNIEWLTIATGDEIVQRYISVLQQADPVEMMALDRVFFERAELDNNGRIGAAYWAFSSEEHSEPHACVKFNMKLPDGRWTQDIGQRVFEENYAEELAKRGLKP